MSTKPVIHLNFANNNKVLETSSLPVAKTMIRYHWSKGFPLVSFQTEVSSDYQAIDNYVNNINFITIS